MDPQTSDFLRSAASVVLGWVLGVGSAALSDWRKNRRRVKAIKISINRELRETAYRLVALVFKLGSRHGGFDREMLLWIQSQIDRYAGPNPKDGVATGVAGLLKQKDEVLGQASAFLEATTPPLFVPAEEAAYTARAVGDLHDQSPDYSVRVLDVLAHLRMFNEARENGVYHTRLTFAPGLSGENHQRTVVAVSAAERQMVQRARIVVDKITALEET